MFALLFPLESIENKGHFDWNIWLLLCVRAKKCQQREIIISSAVLFCKLNEFFQPALDFWNQWEFGYWFQWERNKVDLHMQLGNKIWIEAFIWVADFSVFGSAELPSPSVKCCGERWMEKDFFFRGNSIPVFLKAPPRWTLLVISHCYDWLVCCIILLNALLMSKKDAGGGKLKIFSQSHSSLCFLVSYFGKETSYPL